MGGLTYADKLNKIPIRGNAMNKEAKRAPQIVAHRGASGHAPEITLEACRMALQMKADFLEIDVHQTCDGIIVGIHDPDVSRTTNGRGRIADLTLAELKLLDAGSWFNQNHPKKARPEFIGLQIPTLQEILDLIRDSQTGVYIEIKNPELYPQDFESSLASLIQRNQFENRTLFLSFSSQSLMKTKDIKPSIPTALLISEPAEDPIQTALEIRADELAIRYNLATPDLIHAAHECDLSVSVWTVNEPADLLRMIHCGADRIITNYPDRLAALLEK
jgi:glycerophosphoryl diester phosphodiesterase